MVIQRILEAGAAAACLEAGTGGACRVWQLVWGARYGAGRSDSRLPLAELGHRAGWVDLIR